MRMFLVQEKVKLILRNSNFLHNFSTIFTMIILRIKAGLGNQLFQYAYAKALAIRSNSSLMIDPSWYKNIDPKDTLRVFLLDKYAISTPISEKSDGYNYHKLHEIFIKIVLKLRQFFFKENAYTYYPRLAQPIFSPDNQIDIIEGYWNVPKYFEEYSDIIKKEFRLKSPLGEYGSTVEKRLQDLSSSGKTLVLLHVRRGDYISNIHANAYHGVKDLSYYEDALKRLSKESAIGASTHFVLSSDDTEFLQAEIIPLIKKTYTEENVTVEGEQFTILSNEASLLNYEELHLMSLCHHFIIANSTYSWWAAWLSGTAEKLGQKKIVIGPKQWVNNPNEKTPDVLPPDWITV